MIKCHCQVIPGGAVCADPMPAPPPDGILNPHLMIALESLDSYEHWVSEVLLPIAFQWIHENHRKVYRNISKEHRDDIGVVISAAFELVRKMGYYQEGVEIARDPEKRKQLCLDCEPNIVWTAIAKDARKGIKKAFAQRKHILKYSTAE